MERLEDLLINNLKIYQDDSLYTFTSDSILLSKFAKGKKEDVVADFCSGSGIVGIHFYALNKNTTKSVTLFEMQKPLADLSKKSIELNGLTNFKVENIKIQQIGSEYAGKFSLILCNPPYMQLGSGEGDKNPSIDMCKREVELKLEELIEKISYSLKFGGRTCLVHRVERLAETICLMSKHNIEAKKLQFVSAPNKEPYLFLIEGVKGGKKGIKVLNNINN
ncbi:MAG: methyltransferase [Clostridia bacterium]|nr:methyltransferase [Clostridia bacterium]